MPAARVARKSQQATLHRHVEDEGEEHADAAPEQVGEVDLAAAQLRPAGGCEDRAHQQDGGHRGDEEDLEVLHGRDPADEVEPLRIGLDRRTRRVWLRDGGALWSQARVRRAAHAG